jgi:hypothetical protein
MLQLPICPPAHPPTWPHARERQVSNPPILRLKNLHLQAAAMAVEAGRAWLEGGVVQLTSASSPLAARYLCLVAGMGP